MNIIEKKIRGVYEITISPQNDERGYCVRSYDNKIFEYFGIDRTWVQENQTRTEKRGAIRGLYYQRIPYEESKLIRCIRGSVYEVYVDLRKKSPSFGKWDSVELSEQNRKMLFLPRGFANGFCTLSEVSEIVYKVDNYFNKDYYTGILWNDKDLHISWPVEEPILSDKDKGLLTFADFVSKSNTEIEDLCL